MTEVAMINGKDRLARPIEQDPALLDLVRRTVFPDATPEELKLYFYDCQRQGVHPLDRMIHPIKRGGRYTPVTSIDLFRSRAGNTMSHAGTDDVVFVENDGRIISASVTVYRLVQGERCRFQATAYWSEYYPGDGPGGIMWRKMPHTMLGKCAEALALRKGFPDLLDGLYVREEMDQAQPVLETAAEPETSEVVDRADAEAGRKRFFVVLRQAAGTGLIPASSTFNTPEGQASRRRVLAALGIPDDPREFNADQWWLAHDRLWAWLNGSEDRGSATSSEASRTPQTNET